MSGLIYLASPYSHPDPAMKEARFAAACRAAGRLMKRGERVFSPIAHSHPIEQHFEDGQPEGHDFWLAQDFAVLGRCSSLVVLALPGWEQSKGVNAEIEFARQAGIPIAFMDPQ